MAVTLAALGKADWTDYQDYWRDDDAEWLQERTVLRYATSAARTTDWPTPAAGHVTYNQATDQVELYAVTSPAKWVGLLGSQHLKVTPVTSASDSDPVVLGHKSAGGGGLQFFPTVSSENKIALPSAYLDIGGGKIVIKPSGITIAVGTANATLTTDADALVSNLKFEAPNVTATTLNVTGASTLVGGSFSGTLSGGAASIINANSGTIGGVTLSANFASAPSGYVSSGGYFFGAAGMARIRQRDTSTPFTLGAAGFDITDTITTNYGSYFDVRSQFRLFSLNSIFYYGTSDAFLGYGGPVIYSGGALAAASYPNGTIWVSP